MHLTNSLLNMPPLPLKPIRRTQPSTTKYSRRAQSSVRTVSIKKRTILPNLCKVNPTNVSEQQDLFFQNSCLKNPILAYLHPDHKEVYINRFKPSSEYLSHAVNILQSCLAENGSESNYFKKDGGELLDQAQTIAAFQEYVADLGLGDMVNLVFSDQAIAPTAVSYNSKTKKGQVTVSLPIIYRENRIRGVMHHEIGTHLIRTLNETKQPWYKKRDKLNLQPFLETEEGLAALHTIIETAMHTNKKPYL